MRRTLHLVSARLALRRLHDPMLVARMRGTLGRRLPGVDEEALAAAARPLFAAAPSTLTEVARAVGDRWQQLESRRSSCRIARDSGGWAIPSRCAARPKCSSSATATKYRSSRVSTGPP